MSEKNYLQDEELEQVSGGVNTNILAADHVTGADRCPLSPNLRHQWETLPEKPGCKVCRWCKMTQTAQG